MQAGYLRQFNFVQRVPYNICNKAIFSSQKQQLIIISVKIETVMVILLSNCLDISTC